MYSGGKQNCLSVAKCPQSSIIDGFTDTCMQDITNNFRDKLSSVLNSVKLKRMYHLFKIPAVLLTFQLMLTLYQTPQESWELTSRMVANCLLTTSFLQPLFWMNFYQIFLQLLLDMHICPSYSETAHWFLFLSQERIQVCQTTIDPLLWPPNLSKILEWSLALTYLHQICSLALSVEPPLTLAQVFWRILLLYIFNARLKSMAAFWMPVKLLIE